MLCFWINIIKGYTIDDGIKLLCDARQIIILLERFVFLIQQQCNGRFAKQMKAPFHDNEKNALIVFEADINHNICFWHALLDFPSAWNNINVWQIPFKRFIILITNF